MKIGILGTGVVGAALGKGFVGRGDEVMMGSRSASNEKAAAWAAEAGPAASTGTFTDAAAFGELVVLATNWAGTQNALDLAGTPNFAGKVLIDATNPLDFSSGGPGLALGHTDSAGEQVQRWLPEAKVVKAFNIVNNALMVHPQLRGGPPDMFICGNDEGAKATVTGILSDFGWPSTIDIGGIEGARYLEPLAILWVLACMKVGSWMNAFKLLQS